VRDSEVTVPLYARVMGDAWTQVAEPVRRLHAAHTITRAHGRLCIERGDRRLARAIARLLRLPRPSAAAATELIITAHAGGELWQRTFDGRCLRTRQYQSTPSGLAERYGVLEIGFRLEVSDGSLRYVQREAAMWLGLGRVRLSGQWAPRIEAREDPAGPARVHVHVRVVLPAIGQLIAYDGIIDVEETLA
jgi:hypothetical protein